METTERIVEAYVRHVKRWATIPNVRCDGQNEIDLIAIDPKTGARSHIEVSVSISQGFGKLTNKPFDPEKAKERVHKASQRRTLGYFVEAKFSRASVVNRLTEYGFEAGKYKRIIVTWGWEDGVPEVAAKAGVELWDFRSMMREIAEEIEGSREYFADDTLRTLNLFAHASAEAKKGADGTATSRAANPIEPAADGDRFWVYENWTNECTTVHRASCSHCNDGRGVHAGASTKNGEWYGPFGSAAEAQARAERTKRRDIRRCGHCAPV